MSSNEPRTDGVTLRSAGWFAGDDETALAHRVALRSIDLQVDERGDRPVIGVANSASDLNPCNLPLDELAVAVKRGVLEAGGLPVEFPTISLGEDLMKPSAMLYRNLLAMEIEETLRSYPLDGVILLANCDKTVPGAIMGAVSAGLPTIVITGGPRPVATFRGRRLGTGTDLWRLWDERRAGGLDDAAWSELESCLSRGIGACNTMGTASTMAILTESMGLALPGAATIPAGDPRALQAAAAAGRRIVDLVREGQRPADTLVPEAFDNALRVLNAIGGSTNALIHLAAIAGRAGIPLALEDVQRLGQGVPVVADVEPTGSGLIQDFHASGGVPTLFRALGDLLDRSCTTVSGRTVGEIADGASAPSRAIHGIDDAVRAGPAFQVVRGSLAPDGAVLKRSAATPELLRHRGPAVVFHHYDDMRRRIDEPGLDVSPQSVLVLAGCGPVGVPGMPEWGMIPIPSKLLGTGVRDMVRVTDARMSGTSYGTVFVHAAPEAAVGGPLGLVRDGDMVEVDADRGRLNLEVEPRELERRRKEWRPPASPHLRGWPALYRAHVTQAPAGCDLDFLEAPTQAHRTFVEPVVGRS